MKKDVRNSLKIVTKVLDIFNNEIEELDKRVTMLEVTNKCDDTENDYITIRIPKNANNLDVIRNVFGGLVTESNGLIAHINIDGDTVFHSKWLKTRYRGSENNETNE